MQRRLLFLLVIGIGILLLSGCAWLYQSGPSADSALSSENGTDLTEANMEIPSFTFTNQDEESVSNKDLEGTYWIADMIFTRCPTVCNLMTPNMLNLQGMLEEEELDVKLVSFTVDPTYDDPAQLKKYGENYGVDYSNWHFLTGYSDEDIQQFAKESFRATVQKDPEEDDIIHATSFYLINPQGKVIKMYDGLENDTEPIMEDVKQLTN